ncbi:MAG: AEC family transporter [Acidobacteria bacterium]|nr:AEC family transporter [Acidobacteriota bacterium]
MIAVIGISIAAVGGGILAERRWPQGAFTLQGRLLTGIVYFLLPVLILLTVPSLKVTAGVGAGLAFGWAERVAVFLVAWLVGARVLKLDRPSTGALIAAVVTANTGFLGIPVVAALLDRSDIGLAVTWDAVVTPPAVLLIGFAAGAAFGTKAGEGFGQRARAFLVRNPPLYALIVALLLPESLSPAWGPHAAEIISLAIAPIGFFALGVNLLREHDQEGVRVFPPPFTAPVATAVFLRILFAPALVLLLSAVIVDVPRAFLIEAGMASGINGLAISHIFGLNTRIVVGAVAWSTLIVVVAAAALGVFGVF